MSTEATLSEMPNASPRPAKGRVRMLRRRRRVLMGLLWIAVPTVGMVLLSMAQRDAQAVQRDADITGFVTERLNAEFQRRRLPWTLSLPDAEELAGDETRERLLRRVERHRPTYRYASDNFRKSSAEQPRAIFYRETPLRLFLGSNGRHVVEYDGSEYVARWYSEPEFIAEADRLMAKVTTR